MKRNYPQLLLCLATAFLAGCQTNQIDQTAVVSGSGMPVAPVTAPPVSGQPVTDSTAAEASLTAVHHFNVRVVTTGPVSAETLRQSVEGRLVEAGYKINNDAPDILVQLTVANSVFDRAGDYVRYEGTVGIDVSRAWDGKKMGLQSFSARGTRALGEDEALRNLNGQLVESAVPYVTHVITPDLTGLAAQDVVIHQPALPAPDTTYPGKFIQSVRGQRGVIYCALVAQDDVGQTMTFRVIYLADSMPEGLLNRLVSQPQLKLKARK